MPFEFIWPSDADLGLAKWPATLPCFNVAQFLSRYLAGGVCLRQSRKVSRQRLALINSGIERHDPAAFELQQTIKAYQAGVEAAAKIDHYTIDKLLDINRLVASGGQVTPGIRKVQSWVGGKSPDEATFVPCPPQMLEQLLKDLLTYLNTTQDTNVEKALKVYSQLIVIHPFHDGNGRTCRVLLDSLLQKSTGFLCVNPVLYRLKETQLTYFNENNATVEFWQKAMQFSVDASHFFRAQITQSQQQLLSLVGIQQLNKIEMTILNDLWQQPIVTQQRVCNQFSIGYRDAQAAIERLCQLGILYKRRLKEYNGVIFDCPIIFDCWQKLDSCLFEDSRNRGKNV